MMRSTNDEGSAPKNFRLSPVALISIFVLAIVAMLVLVSRSEYFQLRPASGTAHAIAEAARAPSTDAATRP